MTIAAPSDQKLAVTSATGPLTSGGRRRADVLHREELHAEVAAATARSAKRGCEPGCSDIRSGGALQFSVIQTYNYQNNDAYSTGSQAFTTTVPERISAGSPACARWP